MTPFEQKNNLSSSRRMQAVRAPIIPQIAALIRAHSNTISLGQGVVNYSPPEMAFTAIQSFLNVPDNHKYGSVYGTTELVFAIREKLLLQNSIHLDEQQRVFVTAGSNMAFNSVVLAISEPGDEFILLLPYYFNHEMAITMAGCRAVLINTDSDYKPIVDDIRKAISPRTRAVVTVSPNNPSGAVYSESTLREINKLCRDHGIFHISDEAYEDFVYSGQQHFSPASIDDSSDHTIALYSLSKGYGFASWRIGYMLIPEHLNAAINKVQDTILICPPLISQFAAVGAMQAGADFIQPKIEAIGKVRQIVLNGLSEINELVDIPAAQGAFYVFLKLHTDQDDVALVTRLISEHGVAVIPGSAFGLTGECCLRIAYGALDQNSAMLGIQRLISGLKTLLKS